MDKKQLQELLDQGMTHRQIAKVTGYSRSNVGYWIKKHGLISNNLKPVYKNPNQFNKIDSKEIAYIIGYTLADGYISNGAVEYGCAIKDKEILQFISEVTGANLKEDLVFDRQSRRFPRARIYIGNSNIVTDIKKHCSMKEDKNIPIVKKELKRFLVQGFFDGDGCITWGIRKDRSRVWHKISFTSSEKLLSGIQNILYDECQIPTKIRPKSNENCFVLEFASKKAVLKFLDYIYPDDDFIILQRKYKKANALRLELGEFGEHL